MGSLSLIASNDDSDFSSLIDPVLMASIDEHPDPTGPSLEQASHLMQRAIDAMDFSTQNLEQQNYNTSDLIIARQESNTNMDAMTENHSIKLEQEQSPVFERAKSALLNSQQDRRPLTNDRPLNLDGVDETEPEISLETGTVSATVPLGTPMRQSARQSKVVDRYVPETNRTSPKLFKTERRASSSVSNGLSLSASGKSRRSSSHTSATTHQIAAAINEGKEGAGPSGGRPGSSGSGAAVDLDTDGDPDEAFARALHMEELGLRRRASTRGS